MIDFDYRDNLIFKSDYDQDLYFTGLRYFQKLRRHELRKLLEAGLLTLYPWVRYAEYWWFLEEFGDDNKLYLHGFTYSKEREKGQDSIVIEGIGRDEKFANKEAEHVFKYLFNQADQFNLDPPYCWYD